MSEIIALICDMIIAVLFFTSFYAKIGEIEGFKYEIYSYQVVRSMGLVQLAVYAVLAAECVLFISFAAGILDGFKEWACILLMLFFSVFTIRKRMRTGVTTCACFGEMKWLNRTPIMRNIAIILILLVDLLVTRSTNIFLATNLILLIVSIGFVMELARMKFNEKREHYDSMV
ncbi:hypothetical protein GMA19_00168 [Paenibacillus polymyxa E681]|uniref:MauE/DoxX family redox-associated membrane protein n=1 Tax=Paenibacillus polymyxa TaxID=1406 RepID=UPI0001E315BC|nr:MauE/DoxX family redox-associated membrane protein [Paenibacillus polymyxa]ADM68053.1 hypothetical protein PPE_00168 [Paenibacillus polymyxa E681]QNV55048.1 hypothetical protein GE561_00168 [Paenibacillus polymyxa E681]QNV59885.1 hypothetical protein GMA19_00168 [Paenibacillus polymyxa E681]